MNNFKIILIVKKLLKLIVFVVNDLSDEVDVLFYGYFCVFYLWFDFELYKC